MLPFVPSCNVNPFSFPNRLEATFSRSPIAQQDPSSPLRVGTWNLFAVHVPLGAASEEYASGWGCVCVCVYLGVHVCTAVCWPLTLAETVGRKEEESDVVSVTLCAFCQTRGWPPEYGLSIL